MIKIKHIPQKQSIDIVIHNTLRLILRLLVIKKGQSDNKDLYIKKVKFASIHQGTFFSFNKNN